MQLHFDDDARSKLLRGIEKISRAVKSTLGPRGRTVIIESQNHTRGLIITKDGITVAKSVHLDDPVENMAVRIMREASENTSTSSGDGTSTSIVLAEAIARGGLEVPSSMSIYAVIEGIQAITSTVIKSLEARAKKTNTARLRQIATISCNNDAALGKLIADTYSKVGRNGVVLVENSMTSETHSEVIKGIRLERGYTSKLFVNNHENDSFSVERCRVLMTDVEVSSVQQIENILRPIVSNREPLLIIAPATQQFMATMASNVIKNGLKFCIIEPPQFGYKQQELMDDLALATGGRFFSQFAGDDLSLATIDDLGTASRVTIERDRGVIIPVDFDEDRVAERIEELRKVKTKTKNEKDFIGQRISYLSGGIGVVLVGGGSDVEQKELYDRVDDAVCAVRSALEEGILPGGGVALLDASTLLGEYFDSPVKETRIAAQIMSDALRAPFLQLLLNAEISRSHFDATPAFADKGVNIKTGEVVDMYEAGIIDPLKVTKNALLNAVSVATTIMSTNAIISR
jgi:chaperonin GroEL